MGGGSSKEQEPPGEGSSELREEETIAASTGSLPALRSAFSRLSDAETRAIHPNALEELLSCTFPNLQSESSLMPGYFPELLVNLGPSIVDLLFRTDDSTVEWITFLKGYNRCCGRMSVSTSLNILYRVYCAASKKVENPVNMEFDSDEDDCKVNGTMKLKDMLMILWLCWIMEYASRLSNFSKEKSVVVLPDIFHLLTSASVFCNEGRDDLSVIDPDSLDLNENISVQKLHMWILTILPGVARCIGKYVQARLQLTAILKGSDDDITMEAQDNGLLNCGKAWAISLAPRSIANELLEACFRRNGSEAMDNLLYRSSLHGKGLSRFWVNVEGYHGPLLILVSAHLKNTEGENRCTQWIVAIVTGQGVENRDAFYGDSGTLFSLSPIYRVFPASGKDKNFMYCHLRPTGRVYDPNPKPIGLAFGGTIGNERILIDEDFSIVTFRHHAVDKTYQSGHLFPNQGFLATEAIVLDIEVWGLGGKSAKEHQDTYKKRESIFSEQRRKVDLKTFANWEDSPEKMMLDMVSDPNRVQREDR